MKNKLGMPKDEEPPVEPFTKEEMKRIVAAITGYPIRTRCGFARLCYCRATPVCGWEMRSLLTSPVPPDRKNKGIRAHALEGDGRLASIVLRLVPAV